MRQHVAHVVATWGIVAAFVVEIAVFAIASPDFLTLDNQLNVVRQNAAIAVLAAGMTFVILTGGIDLSVGSIVALAGVLAADVVVGSWDPVLGPAIAWLGTGLDAWHPLAARFAVAWIIGLAAGALLGLVNGVVTTRVRIPPFVATLAMLTIARGLALHYTDSRSISGLPLEFGALSEGALPGLLVVAVFVVAWILLTRTPFGRHVYAVGGNREAARLCGIRVSRVLTRVYVLSGLMAGLGGVLLATRLNSGYPSAGQLFELDAIAAVVIGGTSLMGGRGSIWGTLVGAALIAELNNGLELLSVPYYNQKIVVGVVLIAAAFLDRFRTEDA